MCILCPKRCNSPYRLRYWNKRMSVVLSLILDVLQQYLPFMVLKPQIKFRISWFSWVATVLTVYGIETLTTFVDSNSNSVVATVLTVYGIDTKIRRLLFQLCDLEVVRAPTDYGMRRRVWGSRGVKRRWDPHIASTRTKRR